MQSSRQNLRLRLWLAATLFLIGLALLLFAVLPTTRFQQVLDLPPVVLPTATPISSFVLLQAG